jgi:predicted SprT family Zn-dependent metalloprotease
MLKDNRIALVQQKVTKLIALANKKYNITLPVIKVRFDLRGRCAGMAGRDFNSYYMRFNTDMLVNEAWDHLYDETVPHELAHIVCFYKPELGRNHNPGWKRVCVELGGSGARTHSELVVYAKGRTYVYTSSTGAQLALNERRHKAVQNFGAVLRYRRGKGSVDRTCSYYIYGSATAPKKTVAPVVTPKLPESTVFPVKTVAKAPHTDGASNAAKIRARIAKAKVDNEDQNAVIQYGITTLHMSEALARTYVKNNWSKV